MQATSIDPNDVGEPLTPDAAYAQLEDVNHNFRSDEAVAAAPRLLRAIVAAPGVPLNKIRRALFIGARWCVDPDALADVVAAVAQITATAAASDPDAAALAVIAAGIAHRLERQRTLTAAGLLRIPVVSLGIDCLPFDLFARYGLRATFRGRQVISPFALAVHKSHEVLTRLSGGWDGYADAANLEILRTARGLEGVTRKDGVVFWNHHIGDFWAKDDFAHFRANIGALCGRFDGFLEGCRAHMTVFISTPTSGVAPLASHTDGLKELLATLDRRCRNTVPVLIAVSRRRTPNPARPDSGARIVRISERISHIEVAYPNPNYVWWLDVENCSPAGLAFEAALIDAVVIEMRRWRSLTRSQPTQPAGAATP